MPEIHQDLAESYLSLISPQDARFDDHKATSIIVSDLYRQDAGPSNFTSGPKGKSVEYGSYSLKIHNCGQWLKFVKGENQKLKLIDAKFCKIPFCPTCQWRRALKWRAKFLTLLPTIQEQYPNHRWLLLTLTIKNCELDDLKANIQHLNQSFKRLNELKIFPMIGSIKSLEITRAWDCYDIFTGEYLGRHGTKWLRKHSIKHPNQPLSLQPTTEVHPHLHIVGMVKSSYFMGNNYLSQDKWTELWQQSLRVDYKPIVDIRAIKAKINKMVTPEEFDSNPEADKSGMVKAICEVVKYTVKKTDLVGMNDPDHLEDNAIFLKKLTEQLYRTRRIEYKGVLKTIAKELEAAYNDDNLININDEAKKDDNNYEELTFKWYQSLEKYILLSNDSPEK